MKATHHSSYRYGFEAALVGGIVGPTPRLDSSYGSRRFQPTAHLTSATWTPLAFLMGGRCDSQQPQVGFD